jgi:prolipoprotein diacylglyceryltransferase
LDTYHVVLYVHLLAAFIGVGAASVLVACLLQLRAAKTLDEAVPWAVVAGKTEHAFPIAILGLFGAGAYMTSDLWTWSTGWIAVSLAGLVLLALQGPLVGGRAGKQLKQALQDNGPGPLGEQARRMTRHPGLWLTEFANIGVFLGIVWNMTQKPGTGESIAAVVIGYAVGAIVATRLMRAPAPEAGDVVTRPAA